MRLRTRLRLRLRFRLRRKLSLELTLSLDLSLNLCFVLSRREDRVNAFSFIHQPEPIHSHLFAPLIKGKQAQEAPQLDPDHLQKRIMAAADLPFFQGITENIVVILIHYVHFILFQGGIQRVSPGRFSDDLNRERFMKRMRQRALERGQNADFA